MSNGTRVQKPKVLIVEGKDEVNFFEAAFAHLALADIQVLPIGGKTQLFRNLAALALDANFPSVQCLAVVRDADLTAPGSAVPAAAGAFDSVRNALIGNGLSSPGAHGQFAAGLPRIGVFIMPDGASDGMLETLCIASVSTQPEFPCLTQFFACCQGHSVIPNNLHKARAHAWLSSRPEPDKRVGEAALAGYWPFANPAFAPLLSFLQAM
jgi:hypothetical protein